MSVASELTRIKGAKNDLKTSINAKTDQQHQITNETIDDYADFVDSIQTGGGGNNALLDTSMTYPSAGGISNLIKSIDSIDTSNMISTRALFSNCTNLVSIPQIDTSKAKDMRNMFYTCSNLENLPQLNTSSATNMQSMFGYTPKLTDTSLDNVLKMCININPNYSRGKTLSEIGFTSSNYPASRIQALPSYQDFINAGWTIGY